MQLRELVIRMRCVVGRRRAPVPAAVWFVDVVHVDLPAERVACVVVVDSASGDVLGWDVGSPDEVDDLVAAAVGDSALDAPPGSGPAAIRRVGAAVDLRTADVDAGTDDPSGAGPAGAPVPVEVGAVRDELRRTLLGAGAPTTHEETALAVGALLTRDREGAGQVGGP